MHDHKKCEHQLKFCEHCNIVYCDKCNEEWKKEKIIFDNFSGTQTLPMPWPGQNDNQPHIFNCTHVCEGAKTS